MNPGFRIRRPGLLTATLIVRRLRTRLVLFAVVLAEADSHGIGLVTAKIPAYDAAGQRFILPKTSGIVYFNDRSSYAFSAN